MTEFGLTPNQSGGGKRWRCPMCFRFWNDRIDELETNNKHIQLEDTEKDSTRQIFCPLADDPAILINFNKKKKQKSQEKNENMLQKLKKLHQKTMKTMQQGNFNIFDLHYFVFNQTLSYFKHCIPMAMEKNYHCIPTKQCEYCNHLQDIRT